jgi:hypothetical protein
MTQEKTPTKELSKYIEEIAQKAGFHFKASEEGGLIRFTDSSHFYWTISGELPLTYKGDKVILRFNTRDVNYINALGAATESTAMFRCGPIDGERRLNDISETLTLPPHLPWTEIGCRREFNYYLEVWRQDNRKRENFKIRPHLDCTIEQEIIDMFEEVHSIVEKQFPHLTKILMYPSRWARENYGKFIEDSLNGEYSLLRSST